MTTANPRRQVHIYVRARAAVLVAAVSLLAVVAPASALAQQNAAAAEAREEKNKELVVNFYKALFDDRKVAAAFEKYAAPNYAQHSPMATDVPSTILFLQGYLDGTPEHRWELKRVLADGDLVALHVHSWSGPDDAGRAIVDIFRVEGDRVAEHWEVIQGVVQMEGRSMF